MRKHAVFVINPRSGTDRVKELRAMIASTLDPAQLSFDIQTTTHAGHGTELAADAAAAGAFAVAAVGGDGSVNDVAVGLLGTHTALAIIPKGSGNGMARTLGIPLESVQALQVINQQTPVAVDIGFANGKPFISNAGVGFDALIAQEFAKSEKRGFAAYASLTTKLLWAYKPRTYTVTIDGKELRQQAFLISVANGKQFGYNFVIAPDASFTDGLLDVIIIRPFPKMLGAVLALRAMRGNILNSPYVTHLRAQSVTLAAPGLERYQSDGDARPCSGAVDIRISPEALQVLLPLQAGTR